MTDILIHTDIRLVPSQRKVRNNGVNRKKYTVAIEHEKLGTAIQNNGAKYDETFNNDFMEMYFHRYLLETDRNFENQEEDLLKSQAQLQSLEGQ